jgi:hypothetical protein
MNTRRICRRGITITRAVLLSLFLYTACVRAAAPDRRCYANKHEELSLDLRTQWNRCSSGCMV